VTKKLKTDVSGPCALARLGLAEQIFVEVFDRSVQALGRLALGDPLMEQAVVAQGRADAVEGLQYLTAPQLVC
jgi:hypothetical protein